MAYEWPMTYEWCTNGLVYHDNLGFPIRIMSLIDSCGDVTLSNLRYDNVMVQKDTSVNLREMISKDFKGVQVIHA